MFTANPAERSDSMYPRRNTLNFLLKPKKRVACPTLELATNFTVKHCKKGRYPAYKPPF